MTAPPIPLLIWTLPLVVGIGFLRGLAEGTFFFIVPDVFLTLFARVVRTAGSGGCCWYGQVSMRSLSSAWAGESFPGGGRQLGQQAGQALLEEDAPMNRLRSSVPAPGLRPPPHHSRRAPGGPRRCADGPGSPARRGHPPGTGSRSAPFPGPTEGRIAVAFDREDRQHPAGEPGEQAVAEEVVGRRQSNPGELISTTRPDGCCVPPTGPRREVFRGT